MPTIALTKAELLSAKRATVVLAECFKATNVQAPLQLKTDLQELLKLLRKLEAVAR